jgi:hypothetical protein
MNDLPTREEAADLVRMRDDPDNYDSGTENEYLAPFRVFRAYANGDLMTRAEWLAEIERCYKEKA